MCFLSMLKVYLFISVVFSYRAISPRLPPDSIKHKIVPTKDIEKPSVNKRQLLNVIGHKRRAFGRANPEVCECGKRKRGVEERVVGGHATIPYEFPWLVYLSYADSSGISISCGATLINDRLVATAAHCVTKKPALNSTMKTLREAEFFSAVFHIFAPNVEANNTNVTVKVESIIVHPEYTNDNDSDSDIALLVLDHRVDITDPIFNPICIPQLNDTIDLPEGRTATIAGWGIIARGGKEPNDTTGPVLANNSQKLTIPLHSHETCLKYRPMVQMEKLICGDPFNATGSGQGDSGGPLFIELPSQHMLQIGSVSQSFKKVLKNIDPPQTIWLTYYIRFTYFLPWIEEHSAKLDAKWCSRVSDPTVQTKEPQEVPEEHFFEGTSAGS